MHFFSAVTKGCFYSESVIHFSNLQKTILNLKFKFQAQDSFEENFLKPRPLLNGPKH